MQIQELLSSKMDGIYGPTTWVRERGMTPRFLAFRPAQTNIKKEWF